MQITVSGKQVDTGEALRQHVADQLGVVAQKYFDHALDAQVTFSRNRAFFHCDIAIHARRGLTMRAEGEAADAHAAFDAAALHIAKRLRRYRRKVNDHTRDVADRAGPEAARQVILQLAPDDAAAAEGGAEEVNGHAPAIVAELPEEIQSLSVGEAVMRLDLADRTALMFRDRASGALGVVYRRKDGNIGWIDSGAASTA
ncbi:MAG: ribosome-associated translation inhibitor RaiA, partial [Acetobacteraceae bacterium]|nr:ribosome-associated translation inhibitor RaiA [Acetobacteraceae bacterium]